jgi:TonB family protein
MWFGRLFLVALLADASIAVAAQDPLDTVRQLYASADYEATLAALDLAARAPAPERAAEIDYYRALCLIALGRTADADVVIEHIVVANPRYEPSEDEAGPRVRAAFKRVRSRVLPGVAREHYATGKAAYDGKDFARAEENFQKVLDLTQGLATEDASLTDLRTLAGGFLDLSRAARIRLEAETAPEPAPEPPAAAEAAPAWIEPPVDSVVIVQTLPPWNPTWLGPQSQREFRGAVEVVIDERGDVTAVRMIEPVHPAYDPQLLAAAKAWKYQPARRNGKPIASTRRVDVVLRPN